MDALNRSLTTALPVILLLLLIWAAGLFRDLQLTMTNAYFVPIETTGNIVLVALDDASLNMYGRSPTEWSRSVYADLVHMLAEAEARVIAFDMLFSEASEDDTVFVEALQAARSSDTRTRIVMAAAAVGQPGTPVSDAAFEQALGFEAALYPIFQEAADYAGYVNVFPDSDGTIRRQPSLFYEGNDLYLSFTIASYLAYQRIPASLVTTVMSADNTTLHVTPERSLTVDENGVWRQHFFGAPTTEKQPTFTVVSLLDVLSGDVDHSLFKDKLVLVGLFDSAGATDIYPVPSSGRGNPMPGVEIQANAIETLIQNLSLQEQSRTSEALMIIVVSLFSSFVYALPRWYFKLLLAFVLLSAGLIMAFTIFNTQLLIINLFYLALAILLPVVLAIGLEITREVRQRQRVSFLLESLSRISEGSLSQERIAHYIREDVKRLVPAAECRVFLFNNPAGKVKQFTETIPDRMLFEMRRNPQLIRTPQRLAVPIQWQGQLVGIIQLDSEKAGLFTRRRVQLLQELAERLAPALDNMRLYQVTEQQRDTLQTVLERSPSGIAILDADLNIVESNAALDTYFQATLSNLVDGISLHYILDTLDIPELQAQALLEQLQQAKPFMERVEVAERSFDIGAAPLGDGQWVAVMHDVSDLVELNKLRTQMMRMASHDLKNPLARIIGYAELVLMDLQDESLQGFMNNITRAGDEMNTLIEEILNLERTRSGHIELEDVDFTEITKQVVWRHEPDAVRKQQTYSSDIPEETFVVRGDFRQLSQVVSNLVGNAIKYTPDEGAVTVRLMADDDTVRFEVQDTGYGIAKEAQEKLFTEFYRVQTEKTRSIKGTGLGLSLVKSVIDAHRGDVGVESEEGKGSLFFIELPCKAYDPDAILFEDDDSTDLPDTVHNPPPLFFEDDDSTDLPDTVHNPPPLFFEDDDSTDLPDTVHNPPPLFFEDDDSTDLPDTVHNPPPLFFEDDEDNNEG